ncbi:MAG: hypothetical protein AAB316_23170 [Bacteroidota bacterium]
MAEIQWSTTQDKFVITLDKRTFNQTEFLEVLQWLRVRHLIRKANFDETIETVGEEILTDWWENNKHRFIPSIAIR